MLVIRKKENHNKIKSWGHTQIGGLGEYDSDVFEEVEIESLPLNYEIYIEPPIAMGKDLIDYLNEYKSGMDKKTIQGLLAKLSLTYLYLNNSPCNPFTQKTFDEVVADLDAVLNGNAQIVKQICLGWSKTVRFIEPEKPKVSALKTASTVKK
jgi:hypothetical protein